MNQPYAAVSEITQHAPPAVRLALKALLVGVVCHLSIQVGHAFKFPPHDISALWPTSAVLVSILVASPLRHWWAYLLAGYSTYVFDVARFGFLTSDVLYNVADIVKVLIAAVGVRWLAGGLRAFDNLRGLVLYIAFAVVLAPVTSAFIAALAGAGGNYWFYWQSWCMSEALAFLVLAPAILTWIDTAHAPPKGISLARSLEAGVLVSGLIAISLVVLHGPPTVEGSVPVLVYLPLPFLLWAAVRFGPVGINTALMAVAFLAISGILQGRGPFATPAPGDNVLPLQLFLVMLSLPLMFLAALIAERRVRTQALRDSEARYRLMAVAIDEALAFERLAAELSTGFIYLAPAQIDQFIGAALRRVVGTLGIDRSTLAEFSPDLGFLRFTHSWAANGAEPVAGVVSTDLVPWACARLEAKLPVVFDRMSDLPREASVDEVFWQRTGVRSLVIWPLHVGDELAGSLSLVCLRERAWTETDLERVRSLASIFGNALARKRATEDVDRALRFERLLADISASLLREPLRDPAEAAGRSLQAIGESLRAERVALWRLAVESDRLELEYSWPVEGSEPMPQALGKAELPWMFHRLFQGDIVSLSSSEKLPLEASVDEHTLAQRGVRSLLLVPVMVEGAVSGALSLAAVSAIRSWPEDLLPRMRLLGEMFAVMRARTRASQRLHEARVEAGQYRERLAHLVRVHTVGEMSTSIAHEINQPLMAIENYALAARRRLVSSGTIETNRVEELLDKIAAQASRAGDVLKRLRSMLKKHEPQTTELDLGRLVSDTVKLVEIGGGAPDPHVEVVIAPDLPLVLADEIQIQQVVLNLARNALEAMEGPGVRSPSLTLDVQRSGQSDLVVRVVDNGPGVAPEETERVFEPFYSTKASGLGMGLAICRAIVAAHGGVLSCRPNPSGGAVFQFTLPAVDQRAAP